MKKLLSLFMSLVLFSGLLTIPVSASTSSITETKIKLNTVYVTVPYAPNDIEVNYETTTKEVTATITNKYTGEVIDVLGELIENNKTRNGYYYPTIYSDKSVGPTTSRLYSTLKCYSYSQFRQINAVQSTWWAEQNSGDWKLERETSFGTITDINNAGVGTKVLIEGTANIVVTTTESTTGSFSISALEIFGFSVSHGYGTTYYARTPIQHHYYYSLY